MKTSTVRKILVVGGNGFVGSAVCKAAVARGIQVTSVSSSGTPYRTAKGHSPAWTSNVNWQKGDALRPQSFAHLFPEVDGVVHTLGILLEHAPAYKRAVREGDVLGLLGSVVRGLFASAEGNPLKRPVPSHSHSAAPNESDSASAATGSGNPLTYESMNRDTALRVCEAFISSSPATAEPSTNPSPNNNTARPFIYVSAEDIFRPVIPAKYIDTKREAERGIERMIATAGLGDAAAARFRGVYIRPGLIYHAHHRPLTTPAAALLDLSAAIHEKVPRGIPTPSSILRSLGALGRSTTPTATPAAASSSGEHDSVLDSMANALVIPPIHVDTVADAICAALDSRSGVRGVVGVRRMRELIGWSEEFDSGLGLAST